jgi:hypothetical protein
MWRSTAIRSSIRSSMRPARSLGETSGTWRRPPPDRGSPRPQHSSMRRSMSTR